MDQGALRRVAILIDSLDQVTAARLLASMPPSRASQVRRAIAHLSNVDPSERKRAIADFMQKSHSPPPPASRDTNSLAAQSAAASPDPHSFDSYSVAGNQTHVPTGIATGAATGAATAPETHSADAPLRSAADAPMEFLNEVPIESLAEALADEHPQTVAIVLASMQAPVAAKLLGHLPAQLRRSAIPRLARIDEIPAEALRDISEHLKSMIDKISPAQEPVGNRSLTSILGHLASDQRDDLLDEIAAEHPELLSALPRSAAADQSSAAADQDRPDRGLLRNDDQRNGNDHDSVFAAIAKDAAQPEHTQVSVEIDFDVIQRLPAEALRRVLSQVDTQDAILSLCGMRPKVVDRLLATLPRKQQREVRQGLRSLESVQLNEIDRAQSRVYAHALTMHEQGKLPELKLSQKPGSRLSVAA